MSTILDDAAGRVLDERAGDVVVVYGEDGELLGLVRWPVDWHALMAALVEARTRDRTATA